MRMRKKAIVIVEYLVSILLVSKLWFYDYIIILKIYPSIFILCETDPMRSLFMHTRQEAVYDLTHLPNGLSIDIYL